MPFWKQKGLGEKSGEQNCFFSPMVQENGAKWQGWPLGQSKKIIDFAFLISEFYSKFSFRGKVSQTVPVFSRPRIRGISWVKMVCSFFIWRLTKFEGYALLSLVTQLHNCPYYFKCLVKLKYLNLVIIVQNCKDLWYQRVWPAQLPKLESIPSWWCQAPANLELKNPSFWICYVPMGNT